MHDTIVRDMAACAAGFGSTVIRRGAVGVAGRVFDKDLEWRDDYGATVLRRATVVHVAAQYFADLAVGDTLVAGTRPLTVHDNRLLAGGAWRELVVEGDA